MTRIGAAMRATSLRSKFVDPERIVGGDGEQPNAERPWIIERERGRASETTWLLLTNAIWPASGASRAVICSLDVCGKKEKRTGETIGQPNRTDARRQKVMRRQFLPDQYLLGEQMIRSRDSTFRAIFNHRR